MQSYNPQNNRQPYSGQQQYRGQGQYGGQQHYGGQQQYHGQQYGGQQNGNNRNDRRFRDLTFEQHAANPQSTKSFKDFIVKYIKQRITGYLKNIPKMVVMMVVITVVTTVFGVLFWAIINDSMWMGGYRSKIRIPFVSSFLPYLIGGGVVESTMWGGNGAFKGQYPFDMPGITNSGELVAPLTFALGLLVTTVIGRIIKGGFGKIQEDISAIKPLKEHYERELHIRSDLNYDVNDLKNMNRYMQLGLAIAVIFGFLIRNPFSVPVFMAVSFLNFAQGAESSFGRFVFGFICSDSGLYNGRRKRRIKYAELMITLYYFAFGLLLYSGLNVVLWVIFGYNFFIRFFITIALIAVLFVMNPYTGNAKPVGMAVVFLLITAGLVMGLDLRVFADDNGWTESGGTLWKLMQNQGFPKSLWSSFLPGLWTNIGIIATWPGLVSDGNFDIGAVTDIIKNQWHESEDSISLVDPVTGKLKRYDFVGIGPDGKKQYIGTQFGSNDPYPGEYDEDQLREMFDRTSRNSEYYKDALKKFEKYRDEDRKANGQKTQEMDDSASNREWQTSRDIEDINDSKELSDRLNENGEFESDENVNDEDLRDAIDNTDSENNEVNSDEEINQEQEEVEPGEEENPQEQEEVNPDEGNPQEQEEEQPGEEENPQEQEEEQPGEEENPQEQEEVEPGEEENPQEQEEVNPDEGNPQEQ
nr:hypothetical protein [Lachnospiraceae bacterium]